MNNECGAQYFDAMGLLHTCNRARGHGDHHCDYDMGRTWPQNHPRHGHYANYSWVVDEEVAAVKATMKQTTVLLTLEDLTAISYYMPAYTDDKDDVDNIVKDKIYAALKEML